MTAASERKGDRPATWSARANGVRPSRTRSRHAGRAIPCRGLCLGVVLGMILWASPVRTRAAGSFAEQLAALQSQLAQGPTNVATLYALGRLCYDRGGEGDPKAAELAEKYFRQIVGLDGKQALARGLLGSTMTMRARDSLWPPTRIAYVRNGIKEMDAAVQMAPDSLEVRFVRAENNFHMPRIMGREAIVKADFAWLWEKVHAKPDTVNEEMRQNVALFQGRVLNKAKQRDAALKVWTWGLAVNPGSEAARVIREQLAKAGAHEK